MKSIIITLALSFISICNISAQSKIDAVVSKYENKIQNITFSEKRNPKTKKVYKSTRFLVINDENIAKELTKAFNEERENAIEFNSVANDGQIIHIVFVEDNAKLEYSLISHKAGNGNIWHLSIEKTIAANKPERSYDFQILDKLGYKYSLNDLDLDSLTFYLDDIEGLSNIQIYNYKKSKN